MSSSPAITTADRVAAIPRRRWPATLWIGLIAMLACEALLFFDVALSHRGAIRSQAQFEAVAPPVGPLAHVARWVATNMTCLVWTGLLFFLDGVLALLPGGSPVRKRRHHFWLCWIASSFIWCVFDLINFWVFTARQGGRPAWVYIGMPLEFKDRLWGYVLAFGAIVPGMLLIGQVYLDLGWFDWARVKPRRMHGAIKTFAFVVGAVMLAWPLVARDPVTNLTLWTSLVFLLDPINLVLGRPSMLGDWENGWYGRTLAAFAGGLSCGFLWEFWNFWAMAKWTYDLPFLGWTVKYHYFEMPALGLLGFIPFGVECWVMWQSIRIPLDGLVEPLPDERTLM
jgi:hypothetical protein